MSMMIMSQVRGLMPVFKGVARDVYDIGEHHFLIVNTDRISAFDVVLPTPISGKGRVVTRLSNFWFNRTDHIFPNGRVDIPISTLIEDPDVVAQLEDRSMLIRKARPFRIEAIVRGYLAGSAWLDYCETGKVGGINLPPGLRECEKLPEPLFTPSNIAQRGHLNRNIDLDQTVELIGAKQATLVRDICIAMYRQSSAYTEARGIIMADTRFEFGISEGKMVLINELLTPDTSRFWDAERYSPGCSPPSFVKEFVLDYLDSFGWDKGSPAPELPPEIATQTAERYCEILQRLTQPKTYRRKHS